MEILSTEAAEEQCVQVLAKFDAQACNVCIKRIAELNDEWGEEFYPELMKQETPEVREYDNTRDIHQSEEGVWRLTRRLVHKHRPEETLIVIIVPTAWRAAIWQCVHVNSVSHLGACSTCCRGGSRGRKCGKMFNSCAAHASHAKRASLERAQGKAQ